MTHPSGVISLYCLVGIRSLEESLASVLSGSLMDHFLSSHLSWSLSECLMNPVWNMLIVIFVRFLLWRRLTACLLCVHQCGEHDVTTCTYNWEVSHSCVCKSSNIQFPRNQIATLQNKNNVCPNQVSCELYIYIYI